MTRMFPSSYSTDAPSGQAAVDIFKDLWKSAFPPESKIMAGAAPNFDDARVPWADRLLGGLRGLNILELGPFEAYNTFQFSRLGASSITAVEGNNINYLKCLVAKETLGIDANFLYGDLRMFMDNTAQQFDLCWASGVLYHQADPLMLLRSISHVTNRVFIWTHFFDDQIDANRDRYPHFDPSCHVEKELDGYRCRHYYRSYLFPNGQAPAFFSGGSGSFAYWLRKEDILGYLATLGFTDVGIRGTNIEHPAGPTLSFLASRPSCDQRDTAQT